jgi:hypothetical protein
MYDIDCGAAADLGLVRVRFRTAVVSGPRVMANLARANCLGEVGMGGGVWKPNKPSRQITMNSLNLHLNNRHSEIF